MKANIRKAKKIYSNKIFLLLCFVLALFLVNYCYENVFAANTITITNPTGATKVPETSDFATDEYSDPWDMSEITDIAGSGIHQSGISGLGVGGGNLSGITTSNDPSFFLVHPSVFESIPMGKDGMLHPINTGNYSDFSVRMYASADTWFQVYWFYNQTWTSFGVENYYIPAGWGTYNIDLSANPQWTGNPTGLRLDPTNQAGINFSIDWIKLRKAGTAQNKLDVQWTDSSPGGWTSILVDNDATPNNGGEIYKGAKNSDANNTYQIDLAELLGGSYYVYLSKGGQNTAPQSFIVNKSPLPFIIDPDVEGSSDYATAVSGDPWDMSQLSDISGSTNIAGLNTNGSVISGLTTSNDPILYLRTPTPINTDRYHRLNFRFAYGGNFDLGDGTMTRFHWNNYGLYTPTWQTTQDIVTTPDWGVYNLDLKKIELDSGNIGWNGNATTLRFDPLETITNRPFYLDNVKLCADDESYGTFAIKWEDKKASPSPTTVSFYYDTDNQGFNGTLIDSGINQEPGVNTYNWATGAVPDGTYYIYMISNDGLNTSRAYSSGPVKIMSPSYDFTFVSATNPPSAMSASQNAFVQVHLRNTGTGTWYNEAEYAADPINRRPMRLAVINADGSNFYPANDTWVDNVRIAMTTPTVAPGQIGSFNFTIKAPVAPGYHTLRFIPVVEGVQSLRDIGMQFATTISYDYSFNSAVNPPSTMTAGSTAFVQVHLINTGSSTWYNEAQYATSPTTRRPMRLAVINADGSNFYPANDTWVDNVRIAMTTPTVAPGQIGSFNFTIKAPVAPGYHTLRFIPVVEGVQALRDIGMQFGVNSN